MWVLIVTVCLVPPFSFGVTCKNTEVKVYSHLSKCEEHAKRWNYRLNNTTYSGSCEKKVGA